ncbi:hypothetical protein QQF64_007915 [Cirrhinus molitorella]|uniref:MADF domain-containing protein n=1 Tax=Cirrhinus molitorella TaxID=172907 RepID=A0ABR3M8N9_9TELE
MATRHVVWNEVMEAKLVELWQQHTSLFDVSSSTYHDRNAREKGWDKIATELQLPVNEVKTRVASLRTQYGKLIKPKPSGSGQKPLTFKQNWILRHLNFLKAHVMHRPTESTLRPEDTGPNEDSQAPLMMTIGQKWQLLLLAVSLQAAHL